ncbi:MAG: DEAD/DEAH box helicase family protein [Planctomycetes bacterium]|nr:DEAD/DEAH box helicase family protein [Planctomycetota bacterium]
MDDSPDSSAPTPRRELENEIAKEESRLLHLEAERAKTQRRLEALQSELSKLDAAPTQAKVASLPGGPRTPADKVKLFRELFRGRSDLYPTRFVSKKTGRAGYAPACSNKFVPGICELPKVKCGDCTKQAFRSVDDAAVIAHLRGQHVMGIYAMLADETCWFLAVDFDKSTWVEDVRAFVDTARSLGLPAAVERSRSGNGAHVWFFFSAPVEARVARTMGCHLITETMARRHELAMDSYDRLFPSQDTMPRGGFGNLIALPLQHGPRQEGNSVFLDDDFVAYPGEQQWDFLASVDRIAPETVARIANDASRAGSVVGLRSADISDDEAAAPWNRSPSRKRRAARPCGPLPERVSAVLAQRWFLEKAGLPSPLLNDIKRLAAFQNPEFYKKQSMRLSTAMTPRVIHCAEDLPQHVALPRGCGFELEELLCDHGIALAIEDKRARGVALELRFQGTLTPPQEQAVRALLAHDTGVLVAPPGIGKTVIGTYLVAARACSTLILVHRKPLLDQWIAQLSVFLGIDPKELGRIGAGKSAPTGRLDVAMIQSLVRKDSVADLVADYGQVIVDECHHLPAVSFERVLAAVKATYLVGLTATPQRRDGHHPITRMQLGPVRYAIDAKSEAGRRPFDHQLHVRQTAFRLPLSEERLGIQEIYARLARDEARNELILTDLARALEEGRSPILLTERKDHLDYLASRLEGVARHVVVLKGGMGAKAQREIQSKLASIASHDQRLVLATGRYIGEGFDDARLDTLFLTLPVSWKGTLVQYTGRLHRLHPGKREVRILDYVDRHVPMLLRMFEKRLCGYRAIGYARGDAPLGFAEPIDDPIVEDDAEAVS